jgi:transglycosylase-like protein with SLT domain
VRSRISASGAIAVTTTVSAALALCLLGGVAGGTATQTTVADDASAVTMAGGTSAVAQNPDAATSDAVNSDAATSDTAVPDAGDVLYSVTSSKLAETAASTDIALSLGTQPGLGLLGGVAAEQIPAAAGNSDPATVVATQATLPIAVASPAVPVPAVVLPAIAGTPRQMAYAIAVRGGLNAAQWSCLSRLWQQESKFLTAARNVRSGAYGIPQALPASRMASAGADWRTNPATQIRWGLSYIQTRYGTACTAWSHWERHGWY